MLCAPRTQSGLKERDLIEVPPKGGAQMGVWEFRPGGPQREHRSQSRNTDPEGTSILTLLFFGLSLNSSRAVWARSEMFGPVSAWLGVFGHVWVCLGLLDPFRACVGPCVLDPPSYTPL